MKAYIREVKEGREIIPGNISPEYKTWRGLYIYYIKKHFAAGLYKVDLHYDNDKIYGKSDLSFHIEILGKKQTNPLDHKGAKYYV